MMFCNKSVQILNELQSTTRQRRLIDQAHERVSWAQQIEHALARQMQFTTLALLSQDEATVAKILRENNRFNSILPKLEAEGSPEQQGLIEQLRSSQDDAMEVTADMANAIRDAKLGGVTDALLHRLERLDDEITTRVGRLVEVGRAISSTLDMETVLQTIVARAVQLTGLDAGSIFEYDERTGDAHLRAAENVDEEILAMLRSTPIHQGEGAVGRTVATGEPTQIPDIHDESYQTPLRDAIIRGGYRSLLVVPLLREEQIIGALAVIRKIPGPFASE